MNKFVLLTLLLIVLTHPLFAQENSTVSLSLRECVQKAVEENIHIKTAQLDRQRSLYKRSEAISALIPKVSVGASFQGNPKLQTVPFSLDLPGLGVLPGVTMPMDGTIELGRTFSTAAAISLNWVLYNQTALTATQLARKITELTDLGIEKASEELTTEIAKLYFLTVITAEQKTLVEDNIARLERIRDITQRLVETGFGRQVDYDRVSISLENLNTQLNNVDAGLEQQHNMIKYMLNLPLTTILVLTDNSETVLLSSIPTTTISFSDHIDIRLLEAQKDINTMNQRMISSGYLPSLVLTGQLATHGPRHEFRNYFNDSPENAWYGFSSIGVGLSIPVFDGLEKRAKSQQARMDYQKTALLLSDQQEKFTADYQNALTHHRNSKTNLDRQKLNIELAEKVYNETALKYHEGMATMSDLLQDEMSLNVAQANYLTALFNYKEAELKIMALNGQIRTLIQ
ncbi:MAG: TolC family protein [Bacteroidales bacterium]|nr:TolC family protein [Bacteroidales bacterium]